MSLKNHTYTDKKDFIHILNEHIVNTLSSKLIEVTQIDTNNDLGSTSITVTLNYGHYYEFEVKYEDPGPGFLSTLVNYIDDMEYNIDNETYCVDRECDVELVDTLIDFINCVL